MNKFIRANQHMEESRRNVDDRRKSESARKKRKQIEKEMMKLQAKIGRKVEAGRSRSGSKDSRRAKKLAVARRAVMMASPRRVRAMVQTLIPPLVRRSLKKPPTGSKILRVKSMMKRWRWMRLRRPRGAEVRKRSLQVVGGVAGLTGLPRASARPPAPPRPSARTRPCWRTRPPEARRAPPAPRSPEAGGASDQPVPLPAALPALCARLQVCRRVPVHEQDRGGHLRRGLQGQGQEDQRDRRPA